MSFGQPKHVEKSPEFKQTLEVLLLRARGDNTDSIRVASHEALREIIAKFGESVISEMLPKFTN